MGPVKTTDETDAENWAVFRTFEITCGWGWSKGQEVIPASQDYSSVNGFCF